jgi:serine phosphatase RsbU (regulator of sigma subunit)
LLPLKKLLQASNNLQHNHYDTRVYIGKAVQEVDQIARNVNEMAASIETDMMHRSIMEQDILEEKRRTEEVHQQLQDSIRSAAQIQHTLPASDEILNTFFHEQFHIWKPKDVVGGDIYLFSTLRHEGEGILMMIDCTGHGVPGAFLTMLAQAVYQQLITNLMNRQGEISPAKLLSEFNTMLKKLLKQETNHNKPLTDKNNYHDVGLDAGIVYCDKQRNLVRFAGAHTPLFYLNGTELNVIKGDRHSLGYRSSRADLTFSDHDVIATPFTTFYLTTDGYLDQNGGEKDLPFGKKRFEKIIAEQHQRSLIQQKNNFLKALQDHQKDNHQTDDITLLAFRL